MDPVDLPLVQGSKFRRQFRWLRNVDGVVSATDLSGYNIKSQIRLKEDVTSTLVLDLAPFMAIESSGIVDTEGEDPVPNDRINLFIPADDTAAINAKALRRGAFWDLFLIAIGNPEDGELIAQGAVTIDPAATQTLEAAP